MSTNNRQQRQAPRWWNDRAVFFYHFARSNYITALWNWFLGMAGKAAEPFLFASVLYSGYKLLPHVTLPSAGLDAAVFIAQMATLDIGGMGLMKLAQKEHLGKDSLAYRVGFILVGLMIANVVLSTVERLFPSLPGAVTIGTEAALLIARAVMCVIYGYAVHSLRGDEPAPADIVKAADVHSRLDAFQQTFQQMQQANAQHIAQLAHGLATLETNVQNALHASASLQADLHQQLASSFATLQGNVQTVLAMLPALQAQQDTLQGEMQAQLARFASSTNEELQHGKMLLIERERKQEKPGETQEKALERPTLRALPSVPQEEKGKFDARTFVFTCLQDNPSAKLAELARLQGVALSESAISRYRKEFFASSTSSNVQALQGAMQVAK